MPFTGKVAWARKLGSENMSSSNTTKRRKLSSGSYTVKVMVSESWWWGPSHTGFNPLSSTHTHTSAHWNAVHTTTGYRIFNDNQHLLQNVERCIQSLRNCFAKLSPLIRPPCLTADCRLELGGVIGLATQLELHEGVGDTAACLGKMSGC